MMDKSTTTGNRAIGIFSSMQATQLMHTNFYYIVLPAIALTFSESVQELKFTITAFLITNILVTIFLGVPINKYGGRKCALVSLLVLFIGAGIGFFSRGSIALLMVSRILQSIGVASLPVLARGLVNLQENNLKRHMFIFLLVSVFSGPIIMLVCGFLISEFSWQAAYIFILFVTVIVLIYYSIRLPEMPSSGNEKSFGLQRQWASLKSIFGNKAFRYFVLVSGILSASSQLFYVFSGFFYIHDLKISAQETALTMILYAFIVIMTSRIYLKFFTGVNSNYIMASSIVIVFFGGVMLYVLLLYHYLNFFAVTVPFLLVGLGYGAMYIALNEKLRDCAKQFEVMHEMNIWRTVLVGSVLALVSFIWAWLHGELQLMYIPDAIMVLSLVGLIFWAFAIRQSA